MSTPIWPWPYRPFFPFFPHPAPSCSLIIKAQDPSGVRLGDPTLWSPGQKYSDFQGSPTPGPRVPGTPLAQTLDNLKERRILFEPDVCGQGDLGFIVFQERMTAEGKFTNGHYCLLEETDVQQEEASLVDPIRQFCSHMFAVHDGEGKDLVKDLPQTALFDSYCESHDQYVPNFGFSETFLQDQPFQVSLYTG